LSAALAGLSGRGDHRFEVQIGRSEGDGWWSAAVLVDPARGGLPDGASDYVRRRGMRSDRVAASVLTQIYANRVVGLGIGCWVTARIVPVLSPDCVLLQFDGARPVRTALRYERVAAVDDDALAALGDELFGGHLAHVIDGVRARTGLSERRLWGNVATACATAFVLLQHSAPAHERAAIRADALAFFAVRDWPIHGLIDWKPAAAATAPLAFQRRTCCLFRLIPGEMPCDTCSLPLRRDDTTAL
jgi:ferric iron reductase protein FhuF